MKRFIFHASGWKLKDIESNLPKIANLHFNYIQISPVREHKDSGHEIWGWYQPYTLGLNDETKKDLTDLCREANKHGIKIVCDVVLRHLAGDDYGNLIPHPNCDSKIKDNPDFWFKDQWRGTNPKDRHHLIYGCWGMPTLNYFNHELQDIYIKFLDSLIECGVYSFRVDMCKHFALPEEGCDFFTRVIGRYSDRFNYGECIDTNQDLLNKYSKYINILTEQMFHDDSKLVTWIESHDTYHDFKTTCHMNEDMRLNEWDILLKSHNNVLWFHRPFDKIYEEKYYYNKLKEINEKYV